MRDGRENDTDHVLPVGKINMELPVIDAEQPFGQRGTTFSSFWTTSLPRSVNDIPSSVVVVTEVMALMDQGMVSTEGNQMAGSYWCCWFKMSKTHPQLLFFVLSCSN